MLCSYKNHASEAYLMICIYANGMVGKILGYKMSIQFEIRFDKTSYKYMHLLFSYL